MLLHAEVQGDAAGSLALPILQIGHVCGLLSQAQVFWDCTSESTHALLLKTEEFIAALKLFDLFHSSAVPRSDY